MLTDTNTFNRNMGCIEIGIEQGIKRRKRKFNRNMGCIEIAFTTTGRVTINV